MIMRKLLLIPIIMITFVASAHAFDKSEMEMGGCKKSITISGKLLHVKKTCDVQFDESEPLSLCSYCIDKYKLNDGEVSDLATLGRLIFNQEVREKGKFRACKEMIETFPKLFSY
jgi:hypothetical protein